jgi:mannosyltransferase
MTVSLRNRTWLLAVLFFSVLGAILRFHALGTKSLWLDEASSVTFARLPWRDFLRTMWYGEGNMAFYYFLLRGWLHWGDSEFWLRSLSTFFGVATIPAVYQLGDRFLSRKTGLAAAALLAVNSFHIRYSQELRSYSLLAFLLVVSTYLFLAALETSGRKLLWALYAGISVLAIYTQVFAVFVLAAQWLVFTPATIKRVGIFRLVYTGATMSFLAAPMAAVMLLRNNGQLDWVPHPSFAGFLAVVQNIAGLDPGDSQISPLTIVFFSLYLVALAVGIASLANTTRNGFAGSKVKLAVLVISLWLAFPIVAMLGISFFKPIFISRYLLMCVPSGVLLAAYGLVNLERLFPRGRIVSSLAFLILLILSLNSTRTYFAGFQTYGHDWRGVTHYILSQQQPQDAAIFYNFSGHRVFNYYVARQREAGGPSASPTLLFPLQLDRQAIENRTDHYPRVWLVLDRSVRTVEAAKNAELIRATLETHFRLIVEREFPGEGIIHVALYTVAPASKTVVQ